jgi:RNA polymerase sigma factor (sigma-70 family)
MEVTGDVIRSARLTGKLNIGGANSAYQTARALQSPELQLFHGWHPRPAPGAPRIRPVAPSGALLRSTHLQSAHPPSLPASMPPELLDSTAELLRRLRRGDDAAREALFARCLPLLRRWAHGRLPRETRDVADTDDLVQVSLIRALAHVHEFEAQGAGSFLAYLRQILLNEVRGEMRKRRVRGEQVELEAWPLADDGDSVVAHLVGHERLRSYEAALATLGREQQELVLMRIEFGLDYADIARESGSTPNAVRMRLARALEAMGRAIAARQTPAT